MHPLQFAKIYLENTAFNCESCRCYNFGKNCKDNNKSACIQVKKLVLKILNEKIKNQNIQIEDYNIYE